MRLPVQDFFYNMIGCWDSECFGRCDNLLWEGMLSGKSLLGEDRLTDQEC